MYMDGGDKECIQNFDGVGEGER